MSPEICVADLKRLINENVVASCWLLSSLFLVYLYLSIPTCFGRLCAPHQEKQLYLCDTWYLLFCVDDCLVSRVNSTLHTLYKAVVMEVANTKENMELYLPASVLPPGTPPNES